MNKSGTTAQIMLLTIAVIIFGGITGYYLDSILHVLHAMCVHSGAQGC